MSEREAEERAKHSDKNVLSSVAKYKYGDFVLVYYRYVETMKTLPPDWRSLFEFIEYSKVQISVQKKLLAQENMKNG